MPAIDKSENERRKEEAPGEVRAADPHSAQECTSLRCRLHAWTCDFNGDLLRDPGPESPAV